MYKIIRIATSKSNGRIFIHTLEQDYTSMHSAMKDCSNYNRLAKSTNSNIYFSYQYAVIEKE